MKQMTVILAMMLLLLSCGGRKQLSPEELSHKLDSVKNIEINEKLISKHFPSAIRRIMSDFYLLSNLFHRRSFHLWNYRIVMNRRP